MLFRSGVSLLDRTQLAFIVKEKVQLLPISQLPYALAQQFISEDTYYFNNVVATKADLINNWIIPVKKSWLQRKVSAS